MSAEEILGVGLFAFCAGWITCLGFLRGCGLLRSRREHMRWREREGLPTPSGWERWEDDECH